MSHVTVIALLASLLLSVFIGMHVDVINPDAICYLYSAETFGKLGLHEAMHICPQAKWPFYSIFIFLLSHLTTLSYLTVAMSLDSIFSALSVVFFIAIVRELGGSRRALWFAALVILGAHTFNVLRPEVIRDHGFWCFYLLSLFWMIRFFRTTRITHAYLWSASLLVATLFRIEGAIFLLLLPWVSWVMPASWRSRFRNLMWLNVPSLIILLGLVGYLVLHPAHSLNQLGRVGEITMQWHQGVALIVSQQHGMAVAMGQYVLPQAALRDTLLITALVFMVAYLVSVISNLSFVYAGLVWCAWMARVSRFKAPAFRVLIGYIVVNILTTLGFFLENQFLARRYLVALSLVFMLWIPFALEKWMRWGTLKQRLITILLALLLASTMVGGIFHFGHSKAYIRQAGDWLAVHVPPHATLYTNDYQLMYYSRHFGQNIFVQWEQDRQLSSLSIGYLLKHYDYVAWLASTPPAKKPIKVFTNSHGNKIYIYRG